MTLTELRYVVAVARERHFGRAADACFVSQPTLSVGIKKLEEELGVSIFERGSNEITLTPVGEKIVAQAARILEEADGIKIIAQQSGDPLGHPLRIGAIYTVGPYLLPQIIPILHERAPNMQLIVQEGYTSELREQLKRGKLDVIIISLPFSEPGVVTQPLYDEPFRLAMPADHPWSRQKSIRPEQLTDETILLLGAGHCFRDQVLKVCPQLGSTQTANGIQQTLEGSSLETIRYMVTSGVGMTILPSTACVPTREENRMLAFLPFEQPTPMRRVALAWRKSFPRPEAIEAVRQSILHTSLTGVTMLDMPPAENAQ
ncbi:MAG TPA: LysR substrate-binding domain-containing protein [Methylophilaceae bacterium]|jgi:LysR family hydrogen peroxide-inducible transcriptional activator